MLNILTHLNRILKCQFNNGIGLISSPVLIFLHVNLLLNKGLGYRTLGGSLKGKNLVRNICTSVEIWELQRDSDCCCPEKSRKMELKQLANLELQPNIHSLFSVIMN